jgi:hypothetical protein
MSQICLNLDVSRDSLVHRNIRMWTNLRHLFMDGGSKLKATHIRTKKKNIIIMAQIPACFFGFSSEKRSYILLQ